MPKATVVNLRPGGAKKRPDCADEIRGLELELISYIEGDPELGEVNFTFESSDDLWSCSIRDLQFFNLQEDQ
jgi:hypothetical protein